MVILKTNSLFPPYSFFYQTEQGVDWESVCCHVSLQIPLKQVGTCLDKEIFKPDIIVNSGEEIWALTAFKVENEFKKLWIKLYFV